MDKAKPKVKPKAKPLPYPVSFPAEKTSKVESKQENTLKYPVPPVMEPIEYVDKRKDPDDPDNIKPVKMKKGGSVRGDGAARKGKTRGRVR